MKGIVSSFVTARAAFALSVGIASAYQDDFISTADDSVSKIIRSDGTIVYVFRL